MVEPRCSLAVRCRVVTRSFAALESRAAARLYRAQKKGRPEGQP